VDVALGLVAFWPALALGSFMNVVAARVPQRRSVVRPRSACMSCGSELAWYDNVPVVSWLVLRGRCRSCGARISALYPAVELATAGLVAGCFVAFGLSGKAFVAALAYPAGMGMGDVKLALLLGAMLGRLVAVGLMVGMIAALVPSVFLLARHGSAARKMGIPFAPFLALGAIVALFAGHPLLDAYLSHF
jgi:leader peptidase (prepilin peptidase)/N-methyltransferase